MPFLSLYILKLSVSLAVVFLFYHFVLRKLTFYNWNRWYLLGYALLAFVIPFIDISPVLDQREWSDFALVQWVPVLHSSPGISTSDDSIQSLTLREIANLLIISGIVVMGIRLLIQVISFRRMMRKAKPLQVASVTGTNLKLYQVDDDIIPFSFGNSIFINHHQHSPEELREIVWHEFIHVKQKHSVDIIFGELLCLLNWYNPFAWLIRRAIRQNLEFIADNKVIETGVNKKEYQYLLLKVVGNNHFSIAPKFNFSSLKKRIAMMNKIKSAPMQSVKFLFLLPVAVVMLLAFRNINSNAGLSDKPFLSEDTLRPTVKMPDAIESINVKQQSSGKIKSGEVLIKRKDGVIETYDLRKTESIAAFEKKYGASIQDLLPPPPPPPVSPAKDAVAPVPPIPPAPPVPAKDNGTSANGNVVTVTGYRTIPDEKMTSGTNATAPLEVVTVSGFKTVSDAKVGTGIKTTAPQDVVTVAGFQTKSDQKVVTDVTANPSLEAVTVVGYKTVSDVNVATGVKTTAPLQEVTVHGYSKIITGKEDIIVTINRTTTRDELDKIVRQMKEKGVELEFGIIDYKDGKLVRLTGTLRSGDSRSDFSASDFQVLVLAMQKKGDKSIFKVNIKENEVV